MAMLLDGSSAEAGNGPLSAVKCPSYNILTRY